MQVRKDVEGAEVKRLSDMTTVELLRAAADEMAQDPGPGTAIEYGAALRSRADRLEAVINGVTTFGRDSLGAAIRHLNAPDTEAQGEKP